MWRSLQAGLPSCSVPWRKRIYCRARRIRGSRKTAERGTQIPGANFAVNPRKAQALLAPARQLTPQADEREFDLRFKRPLILPVLLAGALVCSAPAFAAGGGSGTTSPTTTTTVQAATGGAGIGAPPAPVSSTPVRPLVAGFKAKIIRGVAYAPSYAPVAVQRAIWAGNLIRTKPYIYGGGHGAFQAAGYDCSGSVSFVLHAAGLVKTPLDSSDFMSWGQSGLGHWITVYTNPGHAFVEIAGIRFDTSAEADPHPAPGSGPWWRPLFLSPSGFMARHPAGF